MEHKKRLRAVVTCREIGSEFEFNDRFFVEKESDAETTAKAALEQFNKYEGYAPREFVKVVRFEEVEVCIYCRRETSKSTLDRYYGYCLNCYEDLEEGDDDDEDFDEDGDSY